MKIQKLIFTFVFFVMIFGAIPAPALAVDKVRDAPDSKDAKDIAIPEVSSNEKVISHSKTLSKTVSKEKEYLTQSIACPNDINCFEYWGIDVTGFVSLTDGTKVENADVMLLTKNATQNPDYCLTFVDGTTVVDGTTYFIVNQSQATTSSNGEYSIEDIGIAYYNGYSCKLDLYVNSTDYLSNHTIRDVIYDDGTHSEITDYEWNATLLRHAQLFVDLSTNLTNSHSNVNQTYTATVNVTNLGEVSADNVVVNISALAGSNVSFPVSVYKGTIAPGSSNVNIFTVTSPSTATVETLLAESTGVDTVDSSWLLYANDTKTIVVELPAGGDDRNLTVTNVAVAPTMIKQDGTQTADVNVSVLNDGNATALNANISYAIRTGNDCSGVDSTSGFTVTSVNPTYANITGQTSQDYTFTVTPASAAIGNYTICATAAAIDANDGATIYSNQNSATFEVADNFGPEITITSPAGGSLMGPSALLSANTSEAVKFCKYGNMTNPTDLMTQINSTHYTANLTGLANNNNTIYVNCEDLVGNTNETSVTWTVDALGPEIELTNPNRTIIKPGEILNFTLRDSSNVSAGMWNIGGTNTTVNYTVTNQVEYLTINTTSWSGNVTVYVFANDTWGNINNNITDHGIGINITVDDTAPNVTINVPTIDQWFGNAISVNATVVDDNDVSTVLARLENSTYNGSWETLGETSDWTGSINSANLTEGNYTVRINATDIVGNFNDSETVNIQIEHIAPTINITLPLDGADVAQQAALSVNATANDSQSGIADNTPCNVYIGTKYIGDVYYDSNTSTCTGIVNVPGLTTGVNVITMYVSDRVGNTGSDSNPINVLPPPPSAGRGGSGGGGGAIPEQAETLDLELTISPDEIEVISNETASINVTVTNVGEGILNNIIISSYDLADDEYYTDPEGISLVPTQSGELEFLISPESMATGIYRIDFTVGNSLYSEAATITLKVISAEEARARASAESACNDAGEYLLTLEQDGINTTLVFESLSIARTLVAQGDYQIGEDVCNAILALTPEEIASGVTPSTAGITGFFIAVGDATIGNMIWILIAAGLVLGTYVGRKKIAGGLIGLKKKGIKMPKLFPPIKKNGKKNGTNGKTNGAVKEPEKEDPQKWDLSWK